jgi:exonuclease SbcC
MKILSLSFKNINSLKGEHEIDFTSEHFSQNPLFAITGPTGSGKTTILDVISLALFNEVPRIGKISNSDIEQKGAILTKNQKDAYAEVRYECSRGKFVSVWSISTNRNHKLRPYEMELSQQEPQETLDFKKSEVPAENEKLIGLSYSQFIKSVVLAQGEFAKFLKANKKERSQLLEQITGTGIYRELGLKAYRKYKDESNAIEQDIKILEAEKEELLSEGRQKNLTDEVGVLQKKIEASEKKFEQLKNWLRQRSELEVLQEKIETKRKSLSQEQSRQKTFNEENGTSLENHETVQHFSAELQEWKHKNEQLDLREKEQGKLKRKQKEQSGKQQDKVNEISRFVGKNVNKENAEKSLQDFFKKVDALQEKRDALQQSYREKDGLFNREMEELSPDFSAKELLKNPSKWKGFVENTNTEFQQARKNFTEMPNDLTATIEGSENELNLIQNAQSDQRFLEKTVKDLVQTEKALKELETQLKFLPEQIKNTGHQTELQLEELKNLRLEQKSNLMKADLEAYREHLQTGEACPLCGSEEHPYTAEKPPQKDELEAQISAKEKEVTTSQNRLSKLETQREELAKQKAKQENERQAQAEEQQAQQEKFAETYSGKFSATETDWQVKIEQQKKQLKQLRELKDLAKTAKTIERTKPIFKELQEIVEKGRRLSDEIEGLYKGGKLLQDVRNFETSWRDLQQAIQFTKEKFAEVSEKYEQEKKVFSELKNTLLPKLKNKGFESIKNAEQALLPAEKYQALKKLEQNFKDKITGLKSEINTLRQQHSDASKSLKTDLNAKDLRVKKNNLDKELQQHKTENEEHLRLLKNNTERLKKTAEREKKIKAQQQKNRRWKMLNELIGSATGDKFNQFAQDLTLRHLLKLANQRLKELSERYRLDTSEENTDNLVVADLDMGGQRRSVKTLSGGETFLLSLSLALALSDLASKNISINSLFIDEGFGTLDPETLDQTLDTLERLQAASAKTIGIISHVESLKERIGTQIQLQRDGRGYSSLKIVSR